jgi:hypothetical protein
VSSGGLREQKGCSEVEPVNLVPLRWCELERRATHLVTGPVHEHVEACIAVDDLADELRRGVSLTEVPG